MPKRTSKASSHFDVLFGARQGEQLTSGLKLIPRDKIKRGEQPRRTFPATEISELAASLAELRQRGEGIEGTGFLQPLLVTEQPDGYQLIAGERRYRASGEMGIELLPAVVVALSNRSILLAQLVENLQRRDLPPLEEARGLQSLMSQQNLSLREAARVLGKGKGYVENRLNLLKMGADVQEMVSVQTDTLLHARDIDAVSDPDLRQRLIHAVLHEGVSRADLRQRISPNIGSNLQVLAEPQRDIQKANSQAANSGKSEVNNPNQDASATQNHSPETPQQSVLMQIRAVAAVLDEANRNLQKHLLSNQSDASFLSLQVSCLEGQIQQLKRHISELI